MFEEGKDSLRAKLVAEGFLLGKLEAKREAELKAKLEDLACMVSIMERLLTKRFGPISDSTHDQMTAATEEQLLTWAERMLDAPSLAEVFSDRESIFPPST